MVSKLYHFTNKKQFLKWCKERSYHKKACLKAWDGPGYYYSRGRNHISKHIPYLDKRRGKRIGLGVWRHVHDIDKLVKKTSVRVAKRSPFRKTDHKKKLAKAFAVKTMSRSAKIARSRWLKSKPVRTLAKEIWSWIPRRYKKGRGRVWTFIMASALAYEIYKRAKEKGVDPLQYDWQHIIDWSLGYRHALSVVKEAIGKTVQEFLDEQLARWKALRHMYSEEWEKEAGRELDEIAMYELNHLDDLIAV